MKIVPYDPRYKQDFIEMNEAWISAMFELEQEDIRVLTTVESALEDGGQIFFVLGEDGEVMACCMIFR